MKRRKPKKRDNRMKGIAAKKQQNKIKHLLL
jgi:hypothetical protein